MNSSVHAGMIDPALQHRPSKWGGIRIAFWICMVIAVAVVIRRILALAFPPRSTPPQMAGLDAAFASHATLTLVHIIPALLFVILLPFMYSRRFTQAAWIEQLMFPLGVIVSVTAYAMTRYSIGGGIERSAVLFFNSLFLFSLIRAWLFRHTDRILKLRWLTRAVAILLSIATTRPVMGVFFASSRLTHLTPQQFFGVAFWIGFAINTVAIEFWLHSAKGQRQIMNLATSRG